MEKDVKLARKTPVFLSAVLLAINGLAFAGDLIGQASVIDGDTIEIHGTSIRIFGIDASESDQLWPGRRRRTVPLRTKGIQRALRLH
jgi:endonuclease YncB( thermonuclease family)